MADRVRLSVSTLVAAAVVAGLAAAPAGAHQLEVVGKEFRFAPKRVDVEAGEPVEIAFENAGRLSHNLKVKGLDAKTETIQAGGTATLKFTPQEPGTYRFVCTVPGHSEAGMRGKLVVTE